MLWTADLSRRGFLRSGRHLRRHRDLRLDQHVRWHADLCRRAHVQLPDVRRFGDVLRGNDLSGRHHVRSESGLPLHADL